MGADRQQALGDGEVAVAQGAGNEGVDGEGGAEFTP